jgi:hypothetical protein
MTKLQNPTSNQSVRLSARPNKNTRSYEKLSAKVVANWLWSGLVLLLTFRVLSEKLWLPGAVLTVGFLISLPSMVINVKSKGKLIFKVPRAVSLTCSFMLFCYGLHLGASTQEKEANALALAIQQSAEKKKADFEQTSTAKFRAGKLQILAKAREQFEAGDIAGANTFLLPYKHLTDPDLVRLRDSIIATQLRKFLSEERPERERYYSLKRLIEIDPGDVTAKTSFSEIKGKVESELAIEAEIAKRIAKMQEAKQAVAHLVRRYGSIASVEAAVRQRMRNPSSYEHMATTIIEATPEYFSASTEYRGTNAFNAVVISRSIAHVKSSSGEVMQLSSQ